MKVALLCSGLGHIHRGHEVFARDLFTLLEGRLDITLFKGGGAAAPREVVVPSLSRLSPALADVHLPVSPRWLEAAREQERIRIEGETFAHGALGPLLEGGYDVVQCLEQEVCNVVFDNRHLFRKPPKVVFANGGAIPAADLPRCDFVQEHTPYNLRRSDRRRAFMIPHGVDLDRFRPGIDTDFRARHGIPAGAFLALSVGTICHWHKRMDHVIRELAPLPDVHLAIVGQEAPDSAAIRELGQRLMGDRITFTTLPHDQLPQAYAAADVFVLGSLFETFGIVYIEAMAMGLPVFCTQHENQRSIVQQGVFLDMARPGALTAAMRQRDPAELARLGQQGRRIVERDFDLARLAERYIEQYARIAAAPSSLPAYGWKTRVRANARNAWRNAFRAWRRWL
jgi:1,2-diacylglycerol 3-alpha-glucosyltransferase